MPNHERAILHVDMNNFYASVECLYHPELRGKPVAVGGDAQARHGIILAKNDVAKAFGIQTGEALWQARHKCPQLVIVSPHFDLYLRFSKLAREIYQEYTDQIEPFGLDECWLDVSGSRGLFGDEVKIAHQIRNRIKQELGVTVSIGVSYNKIFAKLGSDMKKPDAVTVLTPQNYRTLAWPLRASDLLYVGTATYRKLVNKGVTTIGDIGKADPALLHQWFGKWGYVLHTFANGQDTSPVMTLNQESAIKSVGNSITAPRDLVNAQDASIVFYGLAESVAARLREYGFKGTTVQISLRDNALAGFERQMKLSRPTNISGEIHHAAMELLKKSYHWPLPLRSIGVRTCRLIPVDAPEQICLFDDEAREKRMMLEETIDRLRERFGHEAIHRGVMHTDPALGQINLKEDHVIHPVGYFK